MVFVRMFKWSMYMICEVWYYVNCDKCGYDHVEKSMLWMMAIMWNVCSHILTHTHTVECMNKVNEWK